MSTASKPDRSSPATKFTGVDVGVGVRVPLVLSRPVGVPNGVESELELSNSISFSLLSFLFFGLRQRPSAVFLLRDFLVRSTGEVVAETVATAVVGVVVAVLGDVIVGFSITDVSDWPENDGNPILFSVPASKKDCCCDVDDDWDDVEEAEDNPPVPVCLFKPLLPLPLHPGSVFILVSPLVKSEIHTGPSCPFSRLLPPLPLLLLPLVLIPLGNVLRPSHILINARIVTGILRHLCNTLLTISDVCSVLVILTP
ncbi:GSCOCG00008002001-RA-CDS [Cotesia congregata]|nr:GSCOCG00008002001-RA-CDS [Cotesia congregata]